jgi:hypothetical protein
MPKHLLTIDPSDYDMCWTVHNELMEWSSTSYCEDSGGRVASDDLKQTTTNQTNNTTMKPKLITADNSYLKFEGTSDQAFDFIDAMAQLDASKNIHDLVFNIEVALQREGFLDEDFNRVDDTHRWEDISQDEFDTLMERHLDDIEFTDFKKKTIMGITIKETEWFIHVEDTYLLQSENITAGITIYYKSNSKRH